MKNKIIILIVLVGLGFVIYKVLSNKNSVVSNSTQNNSDAQSVIGDESVVAPEITKVDTENNTYVHKKYGFTFNYPSNLKTSNFREGDGEQILFQDEKGGDWFQIYITPWDESEDISVSRIKQDLPDIKIIDPQNVILGPKQKDGIGPRAVIFFSSDSGLGDTREVWFVYDGSLYQVTTYKRLDGMIGKVLSTIEFKS